MPRVPPRGGRRRGISQYGEEVEKGTEEPDQAVATTLEDSNIDVFNPGNVNLCLFPIVPAQFLTLRKSPLRGSLHSQRSCPRIILSQLR